MKRLSSAALFFAFLFFQDTAFGQPFTLVRDINLGSGYDPVRPTDLTEAGGLLFFKIASGTMAGLWKSDGSAAGTVVVKTISPDETIEALAEVNNVLFFVINNTASSTTSLWKSDGTAAGSVMVQAWPNSIVRYPTNTNGVLYFTVTNQLGNPSELWKSDGTAVGTTLLKSTAVIENLIDVNGTLFFTALEDAVPYHRLWKSDGSVAGTVLVKDIFAGAGNPYFTRFFNANGTLFFSANDGINGEELWKSDGTAAGTIMIKEIEPGPGGSGIRSFVMTNGTVYFFAITTANGYSLWKSNGTSGGTELITSFTGEPAELTNVNDILYFQGNDGVNGAELWRSDGTAAGTVMVKDIVSGSGGSFPTALFNLNGVLYFNARTGGTAIWKSDGTDAGTVLVKDGYEQVFFSQVKTQFVIASGVAYFSPYESQYGYELWKTDGTTSGTGLVKNILPSPGSDPKKFVAANGLVYFSSLNYVYSPGPVEGNDIFQTDGTFSGTSRAERINGRYHSYPVDMANHNGELFISGTASHNNNFDGYELYKISSAGERQVRVKNINASFDQGGSVPHNFQSVGQFLYFSANDDITGYELWKSDGTETGTVMVKDINSTGDSNPENLVNVNGVLYFTANNSIDGIELWKSDGTDAGTVMIKNINASGNSNPAFLTNVNGVLYFAADDGINGIELWKSDGTAAGTVLIKNINGSGNSSNPAFLTNVNGTLYFAAEDGVNGVEVWKSNGTDAGTVMVKDINSGPNSSNPSLFTNLNGIVLFSADDGIAGRELWGSNGTAAETILVKDIQPGATGSNPTVLTRVGGNILFAADDGVHGNEVWLSNGAEANTRMMGEIEPGAAGSDPTEIIEYGSKILVAATNGLFGSEVWKADVPADIPALVATVTAAGPLTICNGQSVQLHTNTGVGYSYQWKRAGVNIAGAVQSNYTASVAGYYTVVVTDFAGSSATSDVAIVTIVNAPLATVAAAGPLTFCTGKKVLLKAITGTGYTYQWRKAGVNIDNATQSNYTATVAGNYSVVVTNATGCSTTSATLNVAVNAVPLATVAAASSLTFCEGKTVQLKAIAGAGYTYQWKRGGADIAGAISSNYNAATTGIYTVIVTNATGCSAISSALNVVVKPLPLATITPVGPTTFCSDKNVMLKANTGTNYTYQWIRGATPIPGAVQSNYTATLPGQYTVIVTNASGCSVTSAGVPVTVNPLPLATITPAGSLTFCAGQNVILKANTGTNYTYQWKKAGINIPDATQVNYTATASGLYSVVVTNAAGCPVISAGVTVTVNNIPLATVAAASSTSFCAGKSVLLKAINGTGYTYQWKKNGINIPQETTSNYTATATGMYSVVVTNATGCSTTSTGINVAVTMAPLATVAIAGPTTFCEGKNVLLKAIIGTGYTYQWKKNGVNIPAQTQSNYTATTTGVYTVAVTNAEGCSTLSADINITVTPAPAAIITANGPLTFPQGGNVVLNIPAAAGNSYQWKKDGVNIIDATSESYAATAGGSYTVVVTNTGGCQSISQPAVVTVTQSRPITKTLNGKEDFVKVYPNPLYRNDYLNIDRSISSTDQGMLVTIYDMAGRKISSQVLTGYDKTIRIKGASGTYMVECRWGLNKRKIFRVIKIE